MNPESAKAGSDDLSKKPMEMNGEPPVIVSTMGNRLLIKLVLDIADR